MIALMQSIGHPEQRHVIIPYGNPYPHGNIVYSATPHELSEWLWELLFDAQKFFPHPDGRLYRKDSVSISSDGTKVVYNPNGIVFDRNTPAYEYSIGSYRYYISEENDRPDIEVIEIPLPNAFVRYTTRRSGFDFEDGFRTEIMISPINSIVGQGGFSYTHSESEMLYFPKPSLRHIIRSMHFRFRDTREFYIYANNLLGFELDSNRLSFYENIGKVAYMRDYAYVPEGRLYRIDAIEFLDNRNTVVFHNDGLVYDVNYPIRNKISIS